MIAPLTAMTSFSCIDVTRGRRLRRGRACAARSPESHHAKSLSRGRRDVQCIELLHSMH